MFFLERGIIDSRYNCLYHQNQSEISYYAVFIAKYFDFAPQINYDYNVVIIDFRFRSCMFTIVIDNTFFMIKRSPRVFVIEIHINNVWH